MKQFSNYLIIAVLVLLASCGPKRERFNYTLIKSKLDLTSEQTTKFDGITKEYLSKARAAYEGNQGDKAAAKEAVAKVFAEQDALIKEVLNDSQFDIYMTEIKIEREGREQHNMKQIKAALVLDSLQSVQFDLANEAFYTTLIDNHDNYHGKPDVYKQYYAELDVSRKEAFAKLMSDVQYNKYLKLAEEYKIGQSEH
jgi:hypothetical protein